MKLIGEEYNPVTGITTQYLLHPNNKTVTVRGVQDADPIFAENARRRNSVSAKSSRDYGEGLGMMAASIPMGLVEEILQKRGINLMTCSDAQLKAILNDSEFSKLRTNHGTI